MTEFDLVSIEACNVTTRCRGEWLERDVEDGFRCFAAVARGRHLRWRGAGAAWHARFIPDVGLIGPVSVIGVIR